MPSVRRRPFFAFLHTYEATGRYWRGLAKAGLIRPGTGVRLVHSPLGEASRRFNAVAKVGGDLHRILQERKCHFIVDRVAGGGPYCAYDFDPKLIHTYAALLGDKLLGGQVHETVCNVHNDWGRFVSADKKLTSRPVNPEELRAHFTWDSAAKWLECGTLDDYAGRTHPNSPQALWKEIEWVACRQGGRFGGRFSYCEGSHHGEKSWHVLYRHGAASCIAEVGVWASKQSQFAIASLRGAAKAAGRPWGVYFAPWGPGGCTSFIPDKDWSWQCPRKYLDDSGWPVGPNLGPSTALQRRIFFHAYMCGAHTLHEEWGAEGNLVDWDQGKLSSYGRVTRDLLDFVEAHPDVGEPYTPLALVMDATVPMSEADAKMWEKIRLGLYQFTPIDKACADRKGKQAEEACCYSPWVVPEVFDIVPSDAPDDLWAEYKEIISVGSAHPPRGAKTYPEEQQLGRIIEAAKALSPFERSSHMLMQVNRRKSDGTWVVAVYNPWGAERGDMDNAGSVLDASCTQRDVLRPKFEITSAKAIYTWPEDSRVTQETDGLHVTVAPGGMVVVEVR